MILTDFVTFAEKLVSDRQAGITPFIKKGYHAYFGMKVGDQDNRLRLTFVAKHVWKT